MVKIFFFFNYPLEKYRRCLCQVWLWMKPWEKHWLLNLPWLWPFPQLPSPRCHRWIHDRGGCRHSPPFQKWGCEQRAWLGPGWMPLVGEGVTTALVLLAAQVPKPTEPVGPNTISHWGRDARFSLCEIRMHLTVMTCHSLVGTFFCFLSSNA